MPLQFKIDVLAALKEKGITTYAIRKQKIMSESTLQKLRSGRGLAWDNIETLCRLLECQPGDLLEYAVEPVENQAKDEQGGCISGRKSFYIPKAVLCGSDSHQMTTLFWKTVSAAASDTRNPRL